MLEFKTEFNEPAKLSIEILVDDARTHTAQVININDFRLNPGGKCPVEILTYIDNNDNIQTIDCYDENGVSKGHRKIANKLGYNLPKKIKYEDIKRVLLQHLAF